MGRSNSSRENKILGVLPTRPAMPRHKGKVKKGIDYVQDNALKAHQFERLQQQNQHLLVWVTTVADQTK